MKKRCQPKAPSKSKVAPDMNVTPLVDIVLVLLIIFMVIAPITTGAFDVRVPPKPDDKDRQLAEVNNPDEPVVVKVDDEGKVTINTLSIEQKTLAHRLRRMLNARKDRVIYLDAGDKAKYGSVLDTINRAREAGAKPIVMVPDKT